MVDKYYHEVGREMLRVTLLEAAEAVELGHGRDTDEDGIADAVRARGVHTA